MITTVMAHASFSRHRVELLPTITKSWGDHLHGIHCDDIRQGAWPTVRTCWRKALELAEGQGHVLAAQDDFELIPGAPELMNALSDRFPDRILAFRWPKASCSWLWHMAVDQGKYWARCNHGWTGGAIALPAQRCEEFLEWAERFDDLGGRNHNHADDARLDMWTLATKIPVWRTRWTLMNHRGDDYSVVRNAGRMPSPEMGVVASVDEIPSLDDEQWDDPEAPEYTEYPEGFRLTASTMLRGRQQALGLP